MRYKTRNGEILSDDDVLHNASKGVGRLAESQIGHFYPIFSGIFQFFIGGYAFLTKSFLRSKLGERTFGLLTIFSLYLLAWVAAHYPEFYNDAINNPPYGMDGNSLGYRIGIFFLSIIGVPLFIFEKASEQGGFDMMLSPGLRYFIILIIIISIGHLIDVYSRRFRGEIVHSLYRGDSWLFGRLEGEKIRGIEITKSTIWMFIEPLFVFIIGCLFGLILSCHYLAFVLKVSAFCLFLEEFWVASQERKHFLDMVDGQLDASYVTDLQKSYEENLQKAQKEDPKDFKVSFGSGKSDRQDLQGSNSPYRIRIY